jgi:hypothetical protein
MPNVPDRNGDEAILPKYQDATHSFNITALKVSVMSFV